MDPQHPLKVPIRVETSNLHQHHHQDLTLPLLSLLQHLDPTDNLLPLLPQALTRDYLLNQIL